MNQNDCTAIFINQLREKVGVIYGNPETTPGGRALKFYSSVRVDIRKADAIKNGTDIVGNKVKVKIVKNKVAPPFKSAVLEIMYGEGISYISELLDLCVDANIVKKAGALIIIWKKRTLVPDSRCPENSNHTFSLCFRY